MRLFLLLLLTTALVCSATAQSALDKKMVEKSYYIELDGIVVKVTLKANPKVMRKMLDKEIRIRRKLVDIHRQKTKIQQDIVDIYRELNIHCPNFEKKFEQRKQHNQQAIKSQRKKLQRAREKRNSLTSMFSGKKGNIESEKNCYRRLDNALKKAIEKSEIPEEIPLEEGENSMEEDLERFERSEVGDSFENGDLETVPENDEQELIPADSEFYNDGSEPAINGEFYDDSSEPAISSEFYDDASEPAISSEFYDVREKHPEAGTDSP